MVRRVEFLIPTLLISRWRKLPLYVNDNYTHHKSWPFFLLRNSTLAICSIFDSFHVWFVHSKNPRKLEAVFTFWQTKNHDQMQCQKKSITSRSENSETFIKQCANANDWQSKRKLLERNLTKNVMPIFVFKVNATRKFWLVSHRMCHQQFTPNSAVSMLLKLHDSRSLRLELHSPWRDSHRTGNATHLVTYFWVVL